MPYSDTGQGRNVEVCFACALHRIPDQRFRTSTPLTPSSATNVASVEAVQRVCAFALRPAGQVPRASGL
jgi:hypothetical protein